MSQDAVATGHERSCVALKCQRLWSRELADVTLCLWVGHDSMSWSAIPKPPLVHGGYRSKTATSACRPSLFECRRSENWLLKLPITGCSRQSWPPASVGEDARYPRWELAVTSAGTRDITPVRGLRDRAILAVLLGCGLRRSEVAVLTFTHLQ